MAPKPFKAVIVGGGVGGLTLANIFEQLGIDYVLLEKYGNFSPQVGASIAMLPSGQRLLDQLGCKAPFLEGTPSLDCTNPTVRGKPIFVFRGYNSTVVKRLGHGVTFNDRQVLLRVLHENVKDKSKLLLNKRVEKVTSTDAGAAVHTKDGEVFEGDIVVGLDGIRSTIREEMWRIAAKASPGYFPKDEWKRVPIDLKCLYGISRPQTQIPAGHIVTVMNSGHSCLTITGPGGKIYFFLFEKLPERITADKTPRYTTEDARALAAKYRDEVIIHDCTFGQIFDDSVSFGMTPIHEHVFEKWHYGRVITLGDAAHKPNPISGHGGNGAMESVAELANQLKRRLDASPGGRLSASDVDAVFRATQAVRFDRAKKFVGFSRAMQNFQAPTDSLGFFARRLLAPYIMSEEFMIEQNVHLAVDAVRIEALPVPFHPHYIPWTDELPAKPWKDSWIPRAVVALVMMGLSYSAGYRVKVAPGLMPDTFLGYPFREFYTGQSLLDAIFLKLTWIFSLVVGSPNPEHRVQLIYFLPMLTPMVLIWMVEANRRGNLQRLPGQLVMWPSVYAVGYQLYSIARVGPIYFLATLLAGRGDRYRPSSRIVDQDVARALLPAVCLGFVLPTVLMVLPLWGSPAVWLDLMTVWQVAPVIVGPLTSFLASVIRGRRGPGSRDKQQQSGDAYGGLKVVGEVGNYELYENKDLPHLLAAYAAVFYGAVVLHLAVAAHVLSTPGLSLRSVFLDLPCWPWSSTAATWDLVAAGAREVVAVVFKRDFVIYAATLLVWCLHTVAEMRRVGYVRTADACRAAAAVAASFVLVGPGAMYAGTWYWREKTIAGQSKMEAGEEKKVQ